jgi:hypothetical protein
MNVNEQIIMNHETPAPNDTQVTDTDKRTSNRSRYSAIQRVAFHEEAQIPSTVKFAPMRCRDISPRGIAFFVSSSPVTQFCTVALTRGETVIYIRCRVVRTCPPDNNNGEWLVGGEFLERNDRLA